MTTERRSKLQGIARSRAHQIVAGAIVAYETLSALDIDEVDVSPWALREGVILQHLSAVSDLRNELPLHALTPKPHLDGASITVLPGVDALLDSTR
ncbi:exopolyphosphatase/pppGpp-phosphohydrolase [Rhodococcus sp. OAS809]